MKTRPIKLANGHTLNSAWYECAETTPGGNLRSYVAWTRRQATALREQHDLFFNPGNWRGLEKA